MYHECSFFWHMCVQMFVFNFHSHESKRIIIYSSINSSSANGVGRAVANLCLFCSQQPPGAKQYISIHYVYIWTQLIAPVIILVYFVYLPGTHCIYTNSSQDCTSHISKETHFIYTTKSRGPEGNNFDWKDITAYIYCSLQVFKYKQRMLKATLRILLVNK